MRACQTDTWAAFARATAPARPSLVGRLDHRRCLALAESSLSAPRTTELTIVPLWACSTDDAPSTEWVAVHGVAYRELPLHVREMGPFLMVPDTSPRADALWDCAVRRWSAAMVVEVRSYAPDLPMKLRAGAFAVREVVIEEVLSVAVRTTEPLPRTSHEVPEFATWFEPRVQVPAALESEIRALSFTAEPG